MTRSVTESDSKAITGSRMALPTRVLCLGTRKSTIYQSRAEIIVADLALSAAISQIWSRKQ